MASLAPVADRPVDGAYRVDISRGHNVGRVSSEWFSRPDDERYLSLTDLYASVRGRAERATTRVVESAAIRVEARGTNREHLALLVPDSPGPVAPTNWSFGQLCSLVGAPASYLRQLPAVLAGINMQHGLLHHRAEQVKLLQAGDGRTELRAVTGPDYGRIWDHELVAAVMKIAGNGTGDTRWKVPGVLDWGSMRYNPYVDVSRETTTLYASDRDVFLFLVDDTHPIEAGRLPNGDPDLYFRGFYCWNSEVGAKTLGIATFYLRAVCQNRQLWGVENFQEISIRHSKFAAARFAHQAAPALADPQANNVLAVIGAAYAKDVHSFGHVAELARAFAVDLRDSWQVDRVFLERFTKDELSFVARECGLVAYAGEKAFAKLLAGKKADLVTAMLNRPGFDWTGRLPGSMTLDGAYGPPPARVLPSPVTAIAA